MQVSVKELLSPIAPRYLGKVISFHLTRGYGFIRPFKDYPSWEDGNLFFHYSYILGSPKVLKPGQIVEFSPNVDSTGKPQAAKIIVVSDGSGKMTE